MNEVATVDQNTAVATNGAMNHFEVFGQAAESTIKGDILKFSKGDWTHGQNDNPVADKHKFVAHPETTTIGWQKWVDRKPVDSNMGMVAQGFSPPRREELGDDDESSWELDNRGVPQDPWQQTTMMYLTNHDGSAEFTFTSGSVGGKQWAAKLCGEYGKKIRTHDASKGKLCPVIYVGSDSYKHAEYGKIFKPTFEIVDWVVLPHEGGDAAALDEDDDVPF